MWCDIQISGRDTIGLAYCVRITVPALDPQNNAQTSQKETDVSAVELFALGKLDIRSHLFK